MSIFTQVEIRNIEDVLPYITEGIRVKEREGYSVVDYSFVGKDTFTNPVSIECRGLKFDAGGRLIARPLHKFFNVGEKESPEDIIWSKPHRVYDKLDGSMIHSCILNDELVFMTRGGISSQAIMAFQRASNNAKEFAEEWARGGHTAIFEFTSPDNRIVVPYDDDELTLLAVRENLSGIYKEHDELKDMARHFGVPFVGDFDPVADHEKFIGDALSLTGVEGYVVAFEDGHRLKIKCQEYAFRHKALATIANERNVLRIVLERREDDIIPNLSDALADKLSEFSSEVNTIIDDAAQRVSEFVDAQKCIDRKAFAALAIAETHPLLLPATFGTLDGKDTRELVVSAINSAARTRQKLDAAKSVFPFSWSVDDMPLHELR